MKTNPPNQRYLIVWSLLFLSNLSALGQEKPTTISASCNNDAAIEIIDQQVLETRTFDDEVGQIKTLIRAADLLWPYRESKARATFVEAFELAKQYYKLKGDAPTQDPSGIVIHSPDWRYSVIKAVAKRDSAWAKKLTRSCSHRRTNQSQSLCPSPWGLSQSLFTSQTD
jgi:hypothetical protein